MLLDAQTDLQGHNNPPSDAVLLREKLEEKTWDLRNRYDELLASCERAPKACADDLTAGKLGDLAKLMTSCAKSFDVMRVAEKEPYLTLGRVVDGFFKLYTENLDASKASVTKTLNAYVSLKAAQQRQAAAEEAARLRAEAEAKAAEAAALAKANMTSLADDTMAAAIVSEGQADKAEKLATGKTADLVRTRGSSGSVVTAKTVWTGRIEDRAALNYAALGPYFTLEAIQAALNTFVRAGGRQMTGAQIAEETTSIIK